MAYIDKYGVEYSDDKKTLVRCPKDYQGEFVVPEGVTEICGKMGLLGTKAFEDCTGLTSITIPVSVTKIGACAFCRCIGISHSIYHNNKLVFVPRNYIGTFVVEEGTEEILGGAFCKCAKIECVKLPSTLKKIGTKAFNGCIKLSSIELPRSIQHIERNAFDNCTSLPINDGIRYADTFLVEAVDKKITTYVIRNNTRWIGESAFEDCTGLTSIDIPESVTEIGESAFCGCAGLTSIEIPNGVTKIGYHAFEGCTGLTEPLFNDHVFAFLPISYVGSFSIVDGITKIAGGAFEGCTGLTSIEIPDSVTEIGKSAFVGCTGLTSIEIPDSVTQIGEWAFDGCTCLNSIEIPNSVTEIGNWAFYGCTGLTSIEIPNSVTEIGNSAFFDCTGLTSIEIPNSVTKIGRRAFNGCTGLTSIEIPGSVTEIGSGAFGGCTGLTSICVASDNPKYDSRDNCNAIIETASNILIEGCKNTTIPNSVTDIGWYAFEGCTGLTSIEIPNSVTKIGVNAFRGCTGLKSIEIPNSVTEIGESAFRGCIGLTAIEIPNSITEIGDYAFEGCTSLTSIEIPNSVTEIGDDAFKGCTNLASCILPNCISKLGKEIFKDCKELTVFEIPNTITKIEASAFAGCGKLGSIEIPQSVVEIGNRAFDGCNLLKRIDIPKSVEKIGDSAFVNIGTHLEICVEDGNSNYCAVEGTLFTKDKQILLQFYQKGGQTEYRVPGSVRKIGECAFEWAKLDSLVLPNGLEEIANDAFWFAKISSIRIPNSIKKIGNTAFKKNELKELHIRHEKPEEIDVAENAFEDTAENCTLYVPVGTGYAYRHHPVFGKFKEAVTESCPKKGISPESFANGIEKKSDVSQTLESKKVEDTITQPSIMGGSANPNDIGVVSTIVFFDTETTGLPQNDHAPISDSTNWPHLVQLAWIVWDKAKNNLIKEKSLIVSPDGFVIPKDASKIHGITHDMARQEGQSLYSVLSEFMSDVQTATHLVGHNIDFDRHVVGAELYRMKMSTSDLMDIPYTCTMQTTIDFCKLPPYNYGHYKFPKLQELYHKLFGYSFSGAHDALADIRATKDCYFELVKRGVIKDIEGFDVFISYAVKDYLDEKRQVIPGNIVSKVQDALRSAGITYWIDKDGLLGGHTFPIEIAKQIKNAKTFIFISSANANQSEWVLNEIATAREYGKTIIPFRADNSPYDTSLMIYLAGIQYIDYLSNPSRALSDLIRAIKGYV